MWYISECPKCGRRFPFEGHPQFPEWTEPDECHVCTIPDPDQKYREAINEYYQKVGLEVPYP